MCSKQIKLGRFRQKQQEKNGTKKCQSIDDHQGKSTDFKRFAKANLNIVLSFF